MEKGLKSFKVGQEFCKKVVDSLNFCVSPYHVVELAKEKLKSVGFKELKET